MTQDRIDNTFNVSLYIKLTYCKTQPTAKSLHFSLPKGSLQFQEDKDKLREKGRDVDVEGDGDKTNYQKFAHKVLLGPTAGLTDRAGVDWILNLLLPVLGTLPMQYALHACSIAQFKVFTI